MLFLNEDLNAWETGNCWITFFLQAQLCYPCLRAPLWKSVSGKTGLVDWILQVLPWVKGSTDVNEHWGQTMLPTPKETMLGAAVVDKVYGQASAQGREFAGVCTNLDDVDSSLEEFVI